MWSGLLRALDARGRSRLRGLLGQRLSVRATGSPNRRHASVATVSCAWCRGLGRAGAHQAGWGAGAAGAVAMPVSHGPRGVRRVTSLARLQSNPRAFGLHHGS